MKGVGGTKRGKEWRSGGVHDNERGHILYAYFLKMPPHRYILGLL